MKQKQSEGAGERIAIRKEQVLMLRSQGYTIRQICDALKIKSTSTVLKDIASEIERNKKKSALSAQEYRDLELNRCNERFGRFAEWRNEIEAMNIPLERKMSLILTLEDRDMKNQERLVKLLNLENIPIEDEDAFDFNMFRERAAEVERKDREIAENPALTGLVRPGYEQPIRY